MSRNEQQSSGGEDKQLASAGSTTYDYDQNGLRTRKTVQGTSTDYYYNGTVLMGMRSGTTRMLFSYDANGNVISVDYSSNSGSTYTTYYYLRNAQNDVVGSVQNRDFEV